MFPFFLNVYKRKRAYFKGLFTCCDWFYDTPSNNPWLRYWNKFKPILICKSFV